MQNAMRQAKAKMQEQRQEVEMADAAAIEVAVPEVSPEEQEQLEASLNKEQRDVLDQVDRVLKQQHAAAITGSQPPPPLRLFITGKGWRSGK